jgi:hypothetical protein
MFTLVICMHRSPTQFKKWSDAYKTLFREASDRVENTPYNLLINGSWIEDCAGQKMRWFQATNLALECGLIDKNRTFHHVPEPDEHTLQVAFRHAEMRDWAQLEAALAYARNKVEAGIHCDVYA